MAVDGARALATFGAIGFLLLGGPSHAEPGQETTRYFSWAALEANPARPTEDH